MVPVSYTHLDVYKRQHQNIPGQKHEVFDREGLSVDFTSRIVTVDGEKVDTVSYTHLPFAQQTPVPIG